MATSTVTVKTTLILPPTRNPDGTAITAFLIEACGEITLGIWTDTAGRDHDIVTLGRDAAERFARNLLRALEDRTPLTDPAR